MKTYWILAGVGVLAAFGGAGCRRAPAEGSVTASMSHGGLERTYVYHVPAAIDPANPPALVIGLHGSGGQGAGQEKLSNLTALCDTENLIAVYPDGIDRSWADGRGTTDASEKNVDDVGFVSALIDHFISAHGADPKRVMVIGMSNGAMMTYRIGCELSSKVAVIGPVAGTMPELTSKACAPERRVPAMIFLGTEDTLVPFEGGELPVGAGGMMLSAAATRARWAELNGCSPEAKVSAEPDADPNDETTVRR
ncbi:MAG: hypothetical protein L6Q76_07050, partial [Polyangiaceae bacterium]|nr:hypothetical protein [Polyangiaceae bacterium]